MEGLVTLGVIFGALGLLHALALRFGIDSRDGSTDQRGPDRPLTA